MFECRRKGLWFGKTVTVAAFVLLTGCTSDFGPWPFPTGYTYHNEEYKAPPGPEPVFKKWEVARKNKKQGAAATPVLDTHFADHKAVAAQRPVPVPVPASPAINDPQMWLSAANDLAGRLFTKFGKPTEPVYLPSPGVAEQDQFFAAALHAALQDQGVAIAAQPGTGPFAMHYKTSDMGGGEGRLLLTITMQSGPQTLAEESGIYIVGGGGGAGTVSAAPVRGAGGSPTSLTAPGTGGF